MKVLMINGSPHKNGCTYTALNEIKTVLEEEGISSEILYLGTKPVAGCIACGNCRRTGKCFVDDHVNEIVARADEFDGIIIGSPVYYAAPTGQVSAFCDRLFYSSAGKFAGKPGAAVVSCRRGGATAAFDRLNKYFTISHMPIVSSDYWNQIHGNNAEEAKKDEEGLITMRNLGHNFAYLLKCIEAGKKAGIEKPKREQKVFTNFIR